jgi:hypothetical protein
MGSATLLTENGQENTSAVTLPEKVEVKATEHLPMQTEVVEKAALTEHIDPLSGKTDAETRAELVDKLLAEVRSTGSGPGHLLPDKNGAVREDVSQITAMLEANPDANALAYALKDIQADKAAPPPEPDTTQKSDGASADMILKLMLLAESPDVAAAASTIHHHAGKGAHGMEGLLNEVVAFSGRSDVYTMNPDLALRKESQMILGA